MPTSAAAVADELGQLGEQLTVLDGGRRAHVDPHRRAGGHHVHLRRLACPQHGRCDPHVPEASGARRHVPAVSCSRSASAPITLADGPVRVAALERHRPVGHLAGEVDAQPQGALGDGADLAALGLAADHGVDVVGAAAGDEVLGAEHQAFLVDEGGEHDAAGERTAAPERVGGEQHRGQAALHVGGAAAPQPAVHDVAAERLDGPAVALGHDVGVPLEHQRRPRPAAAVDRGDHVGPARRHLVDLRLPAERAHLGGDEVGGRLLVEPACRVVHARDAHELSCVNSTSASASTSLMCTTSHAVGSKRPSAAVQPPSTKIVVPVT